ncbi:MAG: hypothetical protein AB1529_03890 [Candidatus Micrarchaeota archaeon]
MQALKAPEAPKEPATGRFAPLEETISRVPAYRSMLLEGRLEEVAGILRASPAEMGAVAGLVSDQNSVVMLRAAEAIRMACARAV